jgi:hypothetical protein
MERRFLSLGLWVWVGLGLLGIMCPPKARASLLYACADPLQVDLLCPQAQCMNICGKN